ncbi:MAG TPA: DNA polymerase IV [Longilinea sp.]|nr:DNA polymerase IV [Longilinea sp.]
MPERKIFHLDLDAFFCSAEELRRPELAGIPFAVGGRPDSRGVVASCSYAARQLGIHSAMPMAQAVRLCPKLVRVSGDYAYYQSLSHQVMDVLRNWSGRIEPISIDEAFLDLTDLSEPSLSLAEKLQKQIKTETGLPCSIGVASNKLVAKMATDVGKSRHKGITTPAAITIVPFGTEREFLAPLKVKMLWGVGPKTAAVLEEMGILTIGQLTQVDERRLAQRFGKMGSDLARRARGEDDRPVEESHTVKSISQETTFARDEADGQVLEKVIRELSTQVGHSLRKEGICACTIRLKLRWADFTTITRQTTHSQPVDQDQIIAETAITLLHQAWKPGTLVRLVGVGAANLTDNIRQLELWDTEADKERRLLQAVDALKEKFGNQTIQRGFDKPDVKSNIPSK